jgi:diadenylate cyclase
LDEFAIQFQNVRDLPLRDKLINVVDILLVAYVIYRLLMLVRGTRAWRIIAGIMAFVIFLWISGKLGLTTLNWLLEKATYLGPAALVILLLPELRTAIEGFGKPSSILTKLVRTNVEERAEAHTVEEIVAAVAELAAGSVGALIVVERMAPLDDFVSNGVLLQAKVSAPLLGSIFFENNPLHDGAVIVRGDTILAAACRLPLSESQTLDQNVHMRHRAAVGISEAFDCLSIVVSEERGTISIAADGALRRLASHVELRKILNKELRNIDDDPVSEKRQPDRKPSERKKKPGGAT